MAEAPIVSAPSIKDIERAIELESAKPNPDLAVVRELLDVSKVMLQQSGGKLRQPSQQEAITAMVAKDPGINQFFGGMGTAPARAWQGLVGAAPTMGPAPLPGRYGPATLAPGDSPAPDDIKTTKMIRQATPMTQLGGLVGDLATFGIVPTRGVHSLTGAGASRWGQVADVAATGAATQALTSPEDRWKAALWGTAGAIAPALGMGIQRALPQSAGGVSAPQIKGEQLLKEFGSESEALIRALKADYAPVPGVSGTSAVVTKDPRLQTLESGSRTSRSDLWLAADERNAQARYDALLKAAGTEAEREALRTEREKVTRLMREGAFRESLATLDTLSMAPSIDRMRNVIAELKTGEQRPNPAVQRVVAYAEKELFDPQGISPQQLYTVRKVLTGQLKTGVNDDIGNAAAAARRETMGIVNQIDETLNSLSGGQWKDYLKKYGEMSKDVSSMSALQKAIDDMTTNIAMGRVPPAFSGKSGEAPLSRAVNRYAMKDFGSKTVDQLTPQSRALVEALKDDLARTAAAMNARATGGPGTAQFLANAQQGRALASRLASMGGAAVGGPVGGIASNVAGNVIESALARQGKEGAEILARLLQDPKYLAAMLEKAQLSKRQMEITSQLGGGVSGAATSQGMKP